MNIKRSRLIRKYLQSPPAKTLVKDTHCNFCQVTAFGCELETHLSESPACKRYYLRNHKTKTVLPILIKEFNCLYCKVPGNIRITSHLQKSSRCKSLYFNKFQTESMVVLQKKLNLLRKQTMASKVNRRLEYESAKNKRDGEINSRTEVDLLNSFRQATSLANCLQCYKCRANYTPGSRRLEEVKFNGEIPENFQTPEMLERRRFQKYHICSLCKNNTKASDVKDSPVKLKMKESGDSLVFAPFDMDEDLTQRDIGNSLVTCILPCSIECLNFIDSQTFKSRENNIGAMYQVNTDLVNLLNLIYENEVHKYKQLKNKGDRFEGIIGSLSSGVLESAHKVVNDSLLTGSESWRRIQYLNLQPRIQQIGSLCVYVSVSVPFDKADVVATSLMQEGSVITVEYVLDSTKEMSTRHYVHNHRADTDCSQNCTKVLLTDYLNDSPMGESLLRNKYLSAYLSSVQLKVNSMIQNFIKSPSSSLHSEEYWFQLYFKSDGTIEIKGIVWLKVMEKLNLQFSKYPKVSLEVESVSEATNHLDFVFSATSDKETFIRKYNMSEIQAQELSDLVSEHQFHFCGKSNKCQDCRKPKLPLLKTLLVEFSSPNLLTSLKFNDEMLRKLQTLNDDEVLTLGVEEWLLQVFSCSEFRSDSENSVVVVMDHEEYRFELDQRLSTLISMFRDKYPDFSKSSLIGCYHYSASTSSMYRAGGVIMERINVRDSYLMDYNVTMIKAFQSKCELVAVNGNSGILDRFRAASMINDIEDINDGIIATHQQLTLTEAFCTFDKKYFRSFTSNPVEYVGAFQVRKKYFKPVSEETEKSFKVKNSKQLFVQQLTGLDRFFLIENDSLNLVAAEFIQNYDFCGESESKKLKKLFSKVVIKDSDKTTAFSDSCYLPELLILKNNDVMKLRNKERVLAFPDFTKDSFQYFYCQVLLYSPEVVEDMSNEQILLLYNKVDDPPIKDESGNVLTTIQRIQR